MHFNLATVLIGMALATAIYLLLDKANRVIPAIAAVTAGVELLLALGIMSLSLSYRIDLILPAVLVITGVLCWSRASGKGATTAATCLALAGAIQLLLAFKLS